MKYTSERCSGIKTGFWSPHSKESVVQKLGAIEEKAPALIEAVCDKCCRFRESEPDTGVLLERHCKKCPLTALYGLIQ